LEEERTDALEMAAQTYEEREEIEKEEINFFLSLFYF
jgi:hypothetical protein